MSNAGSAVGWKHQHSLLLRLALGSLGMAAVVALIGFGGDQFAIQPHSLGIDFDIASLLLGVWLALLIALWWRRRGRLDLFEAPVWFSLNLYGQVVANVWLLQRNYQTSVPWLQQNYQVFMPLAVALIGVALTAMWAAYGGTIARIERAPHARGAQVRTPNIPIVFAIWFVGWAVSNLTVVTGINGYLGTGGQGAVWQNYFYFVSIVQTMAGAVLAVHHFRAPSALGWLWLAVVVGSDLLAALVVGSKVFVFTLIWIAMCFVYTRGKLPTRWLLASVLLVFLLVPVINSYRARLHSVNTGTGVDLAGRITALQNALGDASNLPLNDFIGSTINTFQMRQGGLLDITASALYLHPAYRPYLGLDMINYLIPQLIPRIIWPTKPADRPSLYMITTQYAGASTEYSLSAIGMVADAYRAAGWLFVVVWFALLGAASAYLYDRGPRRGSTAGTILYIIYVTYFIRYEDPVFSPVVQILQFGILLWILLNLIMLRPAKKSTHE